MTFDDKLNLIKKTELKREIEKVKLNILRTKKEYQESLDYYENTPFYKIFFGLEKKGPDSGKNLFNLIGFLSIWGIIFFIVIYLIFIMGGYFQ